MSEPKYRLSLAASEIHYIIQLCNTDKTQPEMAQSVLAKLKLFVAKMQLGIVTPAFSSAPAKASILDQLTDAENPYDRRIKAYNKWKTNPELCSSEDLKQAGLYRYTHDLMTPEEEQEYETRN